VGLLVLAWANGVGAAPPQGEQPDGLTPACLAEAPDLQVVRDDLETARTYLRASKDNFGPGRAKAVQACDAAITSFQQALGRDLAPGAESRTPIFLGRRLHPRMHKALGALRDARSLLRKSRCLTEERSAPTLRAIDVALDGIDEAFSYNPPGNGH
jgi:hypothetical protein